MILGSLLICAPAYISEFLYRHCEEAREDARFRNDHSLFVQAFRVKASLYNLMFYTVYLFRRACFAAVLVFLADHPLVQIPLIALSSLGVRSALSCSSCCTWRTSGRLKA
jgi:hypothetical protein